MKFWVDAQLPPALASWLSAQFNVDARSLRDIGLRDAQDMEIFLAAQREGAAMVSKDSDFVELVARYGPPPQLLWVTCGNISNKQLQAAFKHAFPEALALLSSGQAIVEIG